MLWRAVLTAIAISCTFLRETFVHARDQGSPLVQIKDVICVLLLSGLQKEDLDANTMEKLRRHNVNIYDINNESMRQECLLKSLNTKKSTQDYGTDEGKQNTTMISQQIQNGGLNTQRSNTNNYFGDKANIRTLVDKIKIKDVIPEQVRNMKRSNIMETNPVKDNITIAKRKNNKESQIEYVKNQPNLDNVLKFWNRLTRKTQIYATKPTTTTTRAPPRSEEVASTVTSDNKGYVNPKNIEYINEMIEEYLATQTERTVTEVITTKSKNIDIIARKLNELLDKNGQNQDVDRIALAQNLQTFGNLPDFSRVIEINTMENTRPAQQGIRQPQKVKNYDNNNEPPASLPATPYNPVINNKHNLKTVDNNNNSVPKIKVLQYLNSVLNLNKDLNEENAPASYTETNTQSTITNNVERDRRHFGYQYANIVNNTNKLLRQGQDAADMTWNGEATVSADVIQTIAEKVKEIVMKDIRKELPTTTRISSTSRTVKPILYKNTKEGNQVMQQIMELFKEFNEMRETTTAPLKVTMNPKKVTYAVQHIDRIYPPIIPERNPYGVNSPNPTDIKPVEYRPFNEKLVPIPLGPADRALQAMPFFTNMNPKREYQLAPITFQTNSNEIPPLAIQMSKPRTILSHQIVVTTQNPLNNQKERPPDNKQQQVHFDNMPIQLHHDNTQIRQQFNTNTQLKRDNTHTQIQHGNAQIPQTQHDAKQMLNDQFTDVVNVRKDKNQPIQDPTYADLTKKLRIAENIKNEFRDSYKDRIQKLKERINSAHEQNRDKPQSVNQPQTSSHVEDSRFLGPTYKGLGDIVGSGHHDALTRHLNANYPDIVNRATDSSHQESLISPLSGNHRDTFSRPLHSNLNNPMDTSRHETINHYDTINRADDLNQREIITREVLSRLVGSNHHDVISRLVEPSRYDVINRLVDLNQQSRSHHSDAYERIEHERMHPRYKGARFHEELERGNLPHNNHKSAATCCEMIAARQQIPISKSKQNSRFDDIHFRNFLKSQQKVTDMLERILASKTKAKPLSVETP